MSRLKAKKTGTFNMIFVPVLNIDNKPLMPTFIWKAKKWITRKLATPFWKKGVFCIRLNFKTQENKQDVAVGIDPGSKKEAFTVKSQAHTYLNLQADAVTWVKQHVKTRREVNHPSHKGRGL